MEALCEKLSTNIEPLIGERSASLARQLMDVLHPSIGECTQQEYTFLFMRAASLARSTVSIPKTSVEESKLLATLTEKVTRTH